MTYKEIVQKIIDDPAYARQIADLLKKARKKDQAAIGELNEIFKPLPGELADLGHGPVIKCSDTNPTQWFLVDFAAIVGQSAMNPGDKGGAS